MTIDQLNEKGGLLEKGILTQKSILKKVQDIEKEILDLNMQKVEYSSNPIQGQRLMKSGDLEEFRQDLETAIKERYTNKAALIKKGVLELKLLSKKINDNFIEKQTPHKE